MYKNDRKSLLKGALVPFSILSLMWIIHAFNLNYQLHLFQYGVKPRDFSGLIGVFFFSINSFNKGLFSYH